MSKRNPLGRGLESLIPSKNDNKDERKIVKEIDVVDIKPNENQPRKIFDREKLEELAASIKSKGVIQPILVERVENGYVILAGERRWRAAALAGLKKIPAIVIDKTTEQEKIEIGLIENIQRESLNPVELAEAFKTLMERYGYTQEQVASIVGKSRAAVANTLRLLNLDEKSFQALKEGHISEGHARALLGIEDIEYRLYVLKEIIEKNLSVRDVEKLVKRKNKKVQNKDEQSKDVFIMALEEELENYFKTKIDIKMKKKGGAIVINFNSSDELDRIINILRGEL
ncbi:ParB/RepB/Spo0J family partition protein [Deferribacter autotrophicus]|uniref:ParB/RepB/Spo0J family partition protein n=1 Tax=Deferribacter autotrophicus TaxID=500465 RepID=A0A5A8F2R5_9BACT|nr:ParB/RepB/Spo0J family partition protein [Deferribacter autotrophicus]KAA0257754.1 ParB/RepB/Spo0J family partition protein [Deferribacter autotrophicus]